MSAKGEPADNTPSDTTTVDDSAVGVSGAAAAADSASPPAGGEGADSSPPSTPAAEGAEGVDGSSSAPASGGEAPKTPEAKPADPNEAWKAKKYDSVYARLKAAEAERDALRAGKPPVDDALVQQRAEALAATTDFNRRCNEVAAAGAKQFPDFKEKIGNLRQLVAVPGDAALEKSYGELIEAVIETGDAAARITHELGSNLELAEQIFNLRPVQRAAKLAELAAKKSEPEPSQAPKPVTPVGQRAGSGELINPADPVKADKLSTREWMKRREEYVAKQRAAGVRMY